MYIVLRPGPPNARLRGTSGTRIIPRLIPNQQIQDLSSNLMRCELWGNSSVEQEGLSIGWGRTKILCVLCGANALDYRMTLRRPPFAGLVSVNQSISVTTTRFRRH